MRSAASNWGWLLALAVGLLALTLSWMTFNPVEEVADHVVAPAARSVGVIEGRCPGGWEHSYIQDHVVAETCTKGSMVVTLYPNNRKTANYGLATKDPNALPIPCERIPGWPRDWCEP